VRRCLVRAMYPSASEVAVSILGALYKCSTFTFFTFHQIWILDDLACSRVGKTRDETDLQNAVHRGVAANDVLRQAVPRLPSTSLCCVCVVRRSEDNRRCLNGGRKTSSRRNDSYRVRLVYICAGRPTAVPGIIASEVRRCASRYHERLRVRCL